MYPAFRISFRCPLVGLIRIACLTCSFALLSVAFGQVPGEGSLSGSVSNAQTRAFLEGATVALKGTTYTTSTGRDGRFVFSRVPAGRYTLEVFYTGLDLHTETVEVPAGGEANAVVGLSSEVYALEKFTVAGVREGNAASITKQRNAGNVMNVVSMDAFGNVSDGNIGNFLQKLPGVSANKEAGEIVGVGLRGTPPELNAVTLDGVRMSSAIAGFTPQGDRAALIDQIPSEFIKEIEVVKANTPDMPADSLGGAVNLVTKSAFDFKGRVVSYRTGLSQNTYRDKLDKIGANAAVTVLDTFGADRKFGVALSTSYTQTFNTRDRVQMQHSELDGRNTQARALNDITERIRVGFGSKFEYRIDSNARLFLDLIANYFASDLDRINWQGVASSRLVADYAVVSRAAIEAGAIPRTSSGAVAGVAPGYSDTFTEFLNGNWTNQAARERKRSHQYKVGLGFEKTWSDAKLTAAASFNPSTFDNNFYGFTTTLAGVGLSVDTSRDTTRPLYIQTVGPSIGFGTDFNRYLAQRFEQPDATKEQVWSVRSDYEKTLRQFKFPITLKGGVDYRYQHRWYRTYRPIWNYVGSDGVRGANALSGVNDDNIGQFKQTAPGYGLFNNRYPQRDALSLDPVEALFRGTPAAFAPSGISVSFRPPPSIATEKVTAEYIQADVHFGDLSVLGGVRYESTDVQAQGSYADALNPALGTVRKTSDYAKLFPSLHFRYEPRKNLVMRASYSTSSARPAISDIVPTTTVSYNSSTGLGSVTQNNTGLRPQYSENFDASVEYYFEPAGVISAGWFHKDLRDFIQGTTSLIPAGAENGFGGNYADFVLMSKSNLGQAEIEGWEINFNKRFVNLPAPFNGLGVFANYTKLTTSGTYSNGQSELAGFVPETYNGGLSFDWHGFGARIEYHYKSAYLYTANNANPVFGTRVTDDPTVDINLSYKFRPWLTVFVDVVNVYNNSPDWYTIRQQRIDMSELYGTRLNIGISGRF